MSREELARWTDDAFRTLERAKVLSSHAQAVLESTAHILTHALPQKLDVVAEKTRAADAVHQKVALAVLGLRASHDASTARFRQLDRELDPALAALDASLAALDAVHVPRFLVREATKEGQLVLRDFVSSDDIAVLRNNIAVYRENCGRAHALLQEHVDALQREAHAVAVRHARMAKLYNAQVVLVEMLMRFAAAALAPKDPANMVDTILRENAALEQALVSLLEMLTNHYDQCVRGQQWLQGADTGDVDLDVLRNDTRELASVLDEVGAIRNIIANNEARAAKFVALKTPHIESVIEQCDAILALYQHVRDASVTRVVLLMLRCEEVFRHCSIPGHDPKLQKHPLLVYAEVVALLSYHYTQFRKVFETRYLTELHYEQFVYPRKFLKVLDDYLNGRLFQFEEAERERRRDWLHKYGDFLPKELYLPGEAHQPKVVQVVSDGLEDIELPATHDNEMRLLELIKTLRPQN